MPTDLNDLTACHEFIESRLAQIKRLVQLMLTVCKCTDPRGHTGEVAHQVYLNVREKWDALRSPEKVINTITANTARTHAYKCRREPPQEIHEGAIPWLTKGAHDPAAIYERAILLEQLLNQLDELDQLIMSLLFEGWTFEEIAVRLEMPSSTVRSRYYRAVQQLRRDYSPSDDAIGEKSPSEDAIGQNPVVATTD